MKDSARVYAARVLSKPWGSELVFAELDDIYVGKVIRVHEGQSLSLQYHSSRIETLCVVTGRAAIDFGDDQQSLQSVELGPGDTIHLPAGVLHRVLALEDLVFTEVSTAYCGWRTDVVRIEDRYGRSGTSAP